VHSFRVHDIAFQNRNPVAACQVQLHSTIFVDEGIQRGYVNNMHSWILIEEDRVPQGWMKTFLV
jgi:hypothetical protein